MTAHGVPAHHLQRSSQVTASSQEVRARIRPVTPVSLAALEIAAVPTGAPRFEIVDPRSLLVDEAYQRNLSDRSIRLIRKIIGEWDWRRFKPPVVAETGAGLEVLDGQHTSIAAASHPAIEMIPVMIVEANTQQDRAKAFIGHNRDRLGVTAMQLHYAAVASGDEDAQTIDQVCTRAGLKILRTPPANGLFKPRETVAVGAIGKLVDKRGAMKARQVLQAIAEADWGPVTAGLIKAVDMLMHEQEYAGEIQASDITTALIGLEPSDLDREASVFSATHQVPLWKATGIVLFRKAKRRGRRSAG